MIEDKKRLRWFLIPGFDLTRWAIPLHFGWLSAHVYRCYSLHILCFGISLVRAYDKNITEIRS